MALCIDSKVFVCFGSVGSQRISFVPPIEEEEYLRVSESFDLRGADVDSLHAEQLKKERSEIVEDTLGDVSADVHCDRWCV